MFVVSIVALLALGLSTAHADQGTVHEVRAGETLGAIARQHGMSPQALASANRISNPDLVRIGQKLTVPSAGQSLAKPGAPAKPAEKQTPRTYTVRSGSSASAMESLRHHVSLCKRNDR